MSKNNVSKDDFFNSINLSIRDVLILNGCFIIFIIIYAAIYLLVHKIFGSRVIIKYWGDLLYLFDGAIIFTIYKYKLKNFKFFGLNQPNLKRNIKFAFALIFFIYFTKFSFQLLSGKYLLVNVEQVRFFTSGSLWFFSLHSIIAIAIVPIIEETLFRGFFYPPLRRKFGVFGAIMISSLIFTLWHFGLNIKGLVGIFLSGVLLAYIYEKTASLIPSILVHSVTNLNLIIVTSYKFLEAKKKILFSPFQFLLLLAVIYLALSLLFYFSYKRDKFVA